jgi:hypothetical protein
MRAFSMSNPTARERGLIGAVVHFTAEERRIVGGAAGLDGLSVKEFIRRAGVEAAERRLREKAKKSPSRA